MKQAASGRRRHQPHASVSFTRCAQAAASSLAVLGCGGEQSALDPAGSAASRITWLFWVMTAAAALIWLVVTGLALHASRSARAPLSRERGLKLVVVGGVLFPTVVLTVLLVWGLALLPGLLAPAPAGALRVHVAGVQWWWSVRYVRDDGAAVELANEIHLPVGRPVEFELESRDVIHSFWIPSLGGKVDMIPGRRNRLRLEPQRVGTYRGACAEFCGASHARMTLVVVVEPQAEFERWLAQQAAPAATPASPANVRGAELFIATGCGACHSVRGTAADGRIGPDLTHVGSRLTIGAGTLARGPEAFIRFISQTDRVKPGVHMPAFGMLPAADLQALASYLDGLK